METKFNFNSQVCTSRSQSERLLALGLKKETADMTWQNFAMTEEYEDWKAVVVEEWDDWCSYDIPAWSMHRLIEMMPLVEISDAICRVSIVPNITSVWINESIYENFMDSTNLYDNIIDCIEWLIKEGYFNKEYLV